VNAQTVKNHLVSLAVGIFAGLCAMIPAFFGAPKWIIFAVFGVALLFSGDSMKGWRFASVFVGSMIAGALAAAAVLLFGLPVPEFFKG